jgi:4-amino-4-deoxy-L-arabinose transferase-like glycosyltransferase
MSSKIKILIIIFLALLIRGINIWQFPSLNPDEAALGYNAYSLLETGLDEHGNSWPLHFKSFGDYKPGGYVYLALPFIKLFGLNILSVRLPNLIFSLLTIYLLYKLVLILSKSESISLLSALVLTLSPWHIHFSRGAWEANTSLFFIVWGSYLFFKKSKYFLLPLVFSTYIYHSSRILAPLLALIYILPNLKEYFFKKYIFSIFLAICLSLPVLFSFFRNGGVARFGGVGLTADRGPLSRSEELLNQHPNFNFYDRIIHNRRVLYFLSWSEKYFSHFDLNFLFLNGDEVPRSKSPDMGQLYLIELPLILFGIIFLFQKTVNKILKLFVVSFVLLSPLASSLTFQAPSALRSLPLVIPFSILIAFGINFIFEKFKYFWISGFLIFAYIISFIYFADAYFIHSPKHYPFAWNRGFSEIISIVQLEKDKYQNIFFTNKYDQPYILYLFFTKYPPKLLHSQIKLTPPDQYGFSTVTKIDNITFQIPIEIPQNSLIIDSADFTKTGTSFTIYTK